MIVAPPVPQALESQPRVFVSNGRLVFNVTAFFKGQVMHLILKLNRVR